MEFKGFTIKDVIAHEISSKDASDNPRTVDHSNDILALDRPGFSTLEERIVKAVGSNSHCIEMNITKEDERSAFQKLAKILYADSQGFIQLSKDICNDLSKAQLSRSIPGGMVLVFRGNVNNVNSCVGIIKADKHTGFNKTKANGKLAVDFLSDLFLTPEQKMYKIGIFIEQSKTDILDSARSGDEFKAVVYDHHMSLSGDKEKNAAKYFYDGFLGCVISPTDKKLVKDFFHHTKSFIQDLDVDTEDKVQLTSSLFSYLKIERSQTVHYGEFAERYFDETQQDMFSQFMESKNFPANAITKDLTLIKNQLKLRKLNFSSGAKIVAPSTDFDNLVEVIGSDGDATVVKIKGGIRE